MDSQQSNGGGSSSAETGFSSQMSIAQMRIIYGAFYVEGQDCFKDEKYHEALLCFNAAYRALYKIRQLSTRWQNLDNICQFQILWHMLETQSSILKTHICLKDYPEEDFLSSTYITTVDAETHRGKPLEPNEKKVLATCRARCALISIELMNLHEAVFFAKSAQELDSSCAELETFISRMNEVLNSRLTNGYFPRMDTLEYGEVKDGTMVEFNEKCTICSESICFGQKYALVRECSHTFHHRCLQPRFSEQFRKTALKASFGRWPASPKWLLKEGGLSGPTAEASIGYRIPADVKLKCPSCGGDINYSSMLADELDEWLVNEEARDRNVCISFKL